MLAKRIIPCLDVLNDAVVKGVRFANHRVVGDIVTLAQRYYEQGADELVFYDISASSDQRMVSTTWISKIAANIAIPFAVAGGIRSVEQARAVLHAGADKISVNSPALENPRLIDQLVEQFGSQCVVVGIDSLWQEDDFYVYQYTGDPHKSLNSQRKTTQWVQEVQKRGAGEIVLNCMNVDGIRRGYDVEQLIKIRQLSKVPLIASGGAGNAAHFVGVFQQADVDGALAASVFHDHSLTINELKQILALHQIRVRQ